MAHTHSLSLGEVARSEYRFKVSNLRDDNIQTKFVGREINISRRFLYVS